jgi:hypothetical protein|nr:MAG TPA: hypothetical protein [Caudoviricetes sp.]
MFEIYKFEYDCQFITKQELYSYIGMGILSETDYHRIVGDTSENTVQPQPTQS